MGINVFLKNVQADIINLMEYAENVLSTKQMLMTVIQTDGLLVMIIIHLFIGETITFHQNIDKYGKILVHRTVPEK